jgi:hypothetical protein
MVCRQRPFGSSWSRTEFESLIRCPTPFRMIGILVIAALTCQPANRTFAVADIFRLFCPNFYC